MVSKPLLEKQKHAELPGDRPRNLLLSPPVKMSPRVVVAGVGVVQRQHPAGRDRHRVAHRLHRQKAAGQQCVPGAVVGNGGSRMTAMAVMVTVAVAAAVEEGDVELEQLVFVEVGNHRLRLHRLVVAVVGRRRVLAAPVGGPPLPPWWWRRLRLDW